MIEQDKVAVDHVELMHLQLRDLIYANALATSVLFQ